MEFARVIKGYDHLWAVYDPSKEYDELTSLFEMWNNADELRKFFEQNLQDLEEYEGVTDIAEAIEYTFDDAEYLEKMITEFPFTENLDEIFKPLGITDGYAAELPREKARRWDAMHPSCWLRVYGIKLDSNVYIVTGGAIKLTRKMQDREHTRKELEKLNACKNFLQQQGVFDKESFLDFKNN